MFTFLHAADIHLDSPLTGLSQHDEAPTETIRVATRAALTRLVDFAITEAVDFVLIAGDLYDGDWKDFGTGISFNNEMRRLESQQIPVYLIYGNHDAESRVTKSLKLQDNVHVFSTRQAETVHHPTLAVSVHGQGFATQSVTENLAENYPLPTENRYNIGLLHTNLGDREGHGNYAPSSLPQLVAHGYDYWALGHIHIREIHHKNPHVVYSGNTQGRHVKETGPKGCYLITVDDELETSKCEFVALDSVRWENLGVDCSGMITEHQVLEAIRNRLNVALTDAEGRLLAVRITLTGNTELHEVLHAEHSRFRAECQSIGLDIDAELIWVEDLRLKTRTLINPEELAKQDDLTAFVLDALKAFDPNTLPAAVETLVRKIPPEATRALQSSLKPQGEPERETMRDEISAIVLQAIATSDSAE
ncbi:MAG: metallophosphoesterase family protein [Rubripirellula sp.]